MIKPQWLIAFRHGVSVSQTNTVHPNNHAHTLRWRHNGRDSVSNQQPHDCLVNRLFGRRSKKTSKLRVTGLCEGNSPVTGEFPAQRASNAENVSIWWRHHKFVLCCGLVLADFNFFIYFLIIRFPQCQKCKFCRKKVHRSNGLTRNS